MHLGLAGMPLDGVKMGTPEGQTNMEKGLKPGKAAISFAVEGKKACLHQSYSLSANSLVMVVAHGTGPKLLPGHS